MMNIEPIGTDETGPVSLAVFADGVFAGMVAVPIEKALDLIDPPRKLDSDLRGESLDVCNALDTASLAVYRAGLLDANSLTDALHESCSVSINDAHSIATEYCLTRDSTPDADPTADDPALDKTGCAQADADARARGLLTLREAIARWNQGHPDGRLEIDDLDDEDHRNLDVRAYRSFRQSPRPSIDLVPGNLPAIVDAAEQVLVNRAEGLKTFQRAGEIVRIISLTNDDIARAHKRDALNRPEGSVVLHPVSVTSLQETFDRLITWQVTNPEGESKPKDCPTKISATYLSRVGSWKLPPLVGVIEVPTLRPDGTVLSTPGYDRSTGLYLNCVNRWPAMPERPSRADAEIALRDLVEPFAEFPFVSDGDRSVFIAGILTALQRRLLETAPLFGFSAPGQRTGKSRLVESIGIIATGRMPAASGVSKEGEELRKAITSILREGHLIAHLDNIIYALDSAHLARAITTVGLYSDRLLGTNSNLHLPTNVMWTATGNNLTFRGDMPTRAVVCRIDALMEHPEERSFRIPNLRAYLLENRERLAIAALTILRAYHVAGRPKQDVKPWGGFDHWSREIREPLIWLGCADPCATRERIVVADPDRELAIEIFDCWHEVFSDRPMLVREVIETAAQGAHDKLKQTLLMVAAKRDDSREIDPRRLGNWLSAIRDRVINERRITVDRKIHKTQAWRLASMSSVSFKPADQNRSTDRPEVEIDIE